MKKGTEITARKPGQAIPPRVYFRVAVQCILTLFMLWYFALRLGEAFVLPLLVSLRPNHALGAMDGIYLLGGSFTIALIIVSALVKRGIRDEMKKKDQPFFLTAKDPRIDLKPIRMSKKEIFWRVAIAFCVSQLFMLPLTLIGALRVITDELPLGAVIDLFFAGYWKPYGVSFLICSLTALSLPYIVERWHWTKIQF